jgi:glutamine synthetase
MPGNLTMDALREKVALGEIDTVILAQVDMQGRLVGKRFHGGYFVEHGLTETHCCNYLFTVDMEMEPVPGFASASWEKGYGDYAIKADPATLRLIPWAPGTALALCDTFDHHGHDMVPVAPRSILRRQIARLEAMGLTAAMASELEFYLFRDSFEAAHGKGYRGLEPIGTYNEDYHIFQTAKEEDVMRAIRNGLAGAGVVVENSKGEAWAGQEEINVRFSDALDAADTHSITKHGVKEIAWSKGRAVTFMAKYDYRAAGSSAHIHQSLWHQDGRPAFLDPADAQGMSQMMRHYMAGLLAHSSEITLFLAPNINSYKRFQAGTFAPTKAVWSADNRTAGYRVVGEGTKAVRVECRIGGADLNPYLAYAALLAAGMSGIERKLALEREFRGDAYAARRVREIPKTLRAATEAARRSKMLRAAMGDEVVDHYVHAAEWEQSEYDRRVTDWEIARGFERG